MPIYWIDPNSFVLEAKDKEEALALAIDLIEKEPCTVCPLEVREE